METDENEEKLLRSVALQNANSILLARQQAEVELRALKDRLAADLQAMTHLHHVGSCCVQPGKRFDECLGEIVEAAIAVTGANKGNMQLLDASSGALKLVAHRGFDEPFLSFFAMVHDEAAACGAAMQRSERVVVEDVTQSRIFTGTPALDVLLDAGVRAVQSTPLLSSAGHLLGMISTHFSEPRHLFERELRLMDLLARQAADYVERKRAEEALRQSEGRFRSLVVATSQVVWTTDPEGQVVEDSPSWRAFTGQTYKQWKGWGWLDAIHPDDRERTAQGWRQCVADKCFCQTEYRVRTVDGSYRWTAVRAVPVLKADGRIREWIGTNTDITERKWAEEALRQSEQRFARFMEHLPGLAWTKDLKGRYTYANELAKQVFRKTDAQLYGKTDDEIFPPDTAAQFKDNDRRALTSGVGVQVVETLRHEDSALHHSLVSKFPIRGEDGTLVAIGGMAVDITDLKRAEEALKQADRRKDEFLATLAHELRNPLAPIRNSLHILRMTGGNAPAAGRVHEMMERQVNHMVRLVDDLMEVSRITRGQIELRKERIELASVIRSAVETAKLFIESAAHQLHLSIPPEPVLLEADPVRLAQVFANLLNNAAKYTANGGQIWVNAKLEGGNLTVSVRDTGIGIAADMLPRVFDLFTQADNRRAQGGLGIGLNLVRSLLKLHGGSVEAKSEGEGKGSEFIVRLPVVAARVHGYTLVAEHAARPISLRRILVVDDNRDAADSLGMLLRFTGADAHVVYDGRAALEALETYQPGIVLLDIGMPEMDGIEVARRIRQHPEFKNVTIIALTGWGQEHDRRLTRRAGFDHHLIKPADINALEALLASLENKQVRSKTD